MDNNKIDIIDITCKQHESKPIITIDVICSNACWYRITMRKNSILMNRVELSLDKSDISWYIDKDHYEIYNRQSLILPIPIVIDECYHFNDLIATYSLRSRALFCIDDIFEKYIPEKSNIAQIRELVFDVINQNYDVYMFMKNIYDNKLLKEDDNISIKTVAIETNEDKSSIEIYKLKGDTFYKIWIRRDSNNAKYLISFYELKDNILFYPNISECEVEHYIMFPGPFYIDGEKPFNLDSAGVHYIFDTKKLIISNAKLYTTTYGHDDYDIIYSLENDEEFHDFAKYNADKDFEDSVMDDIKNNDFSKWQQVPIVEFPGFDRNCDIDEPIRLGDIEYTIDFAVSNRNARNYSQEFIYRTFGYPLAADKTLIDIKFNKNATILIWSNGSKTVVKCAKSDNYNPLAGVAIALFKENIGGDFRDFLNFIDEKYEESKEFEKRKEARAAKKKEKKKKAEKAVKQKAVEDKLLQQAENQYKRRTRKSSK